MERFTRLFENLLVFVYHCFDRIVIHGYLSGLSRPQQVVYFVRHVLGIPVVSKEVLSPRTDDYRNWVEAYARNHKIPMEWAEKGIRKEDHVLPALRRMEKRAAYGVYFIFKSMEQGRTFRITVPKYPTQDPNHRILAHQRSRFTHDYFYIREIPDQDRPVLSQTPLCATGQQPLPSPTRPSAPSQQQTRSGLSQGRQGD
jgi:hypothetical protein